MQYLFLTFRKYHCQTLQYFSQKYTFSYSQIEDLQWKNLRKYKKIFDFMCNSYELSIESPKIMVSSFSKLVSLKLHLLGYDRIPKAVDQICARLEVQVKNLELHHLQMAFKCFNNLPTNYNRKLFVLLFEQIVSRVDKQIFDPSNLPIRRMNKDQLNIFMTSYFKKGISIKDTIYYINSEESSLFFISEVFQKEITKQFLKPIDHKHSKASYCGYFSTARALLDNHGLPEQERDKIYEQLKDVHHSAFGKIGEDISFSTSLCGCLNVYSIQLQKSIFGNKRSQLKQFVLAEIKKFNNKKFSSNWKVKKYYAQIRQVIRKHANSRFDEIQQLVNLIIENDLRTQNQLDSVAFPNYIFLLEECENNQTYKDILLKIYRHLKGEDAYSFIQTYIRYPNKSSRLNSALIRKIWNNNKDPAMMLKIIAAVPKIYFQNNFATLLQPISAILEDSATLMNINSLKHFSLGQVTNIMIFCRYFLQNTKIFTHKVLLITLSYFINRQKQEIVHKNDEMKISFFIEIINLCIQLNHHDKHTYINKISQLMENYQTKNVENLFSVVRFLQIKLTLKGSVPLREPISEKVKDILLKMKLGQVAEQFKIKVILLKLHALQYISLSPFQLSSFGQQIKKGLKQQKIHPSDIQTLLGINFIDQSGLVNINKAKYLKEIVLYSLSTIKVQQDTEYYIYYLRLGHKIKWEEVISLCLEPLAMFPLEPSHIIILTSILKAYPHIFIPNLLQRFIKDVATSFSIFKGYYLDILYFVNILYCDPPSCYNHLFERMLNEAEKQLNNQLAKQSQNHLILQKTYKYFWIVIKNNKVTHQTVSIFKNNIRFIQNIYEILAFKSFDGLSSNIIYMINNYLFSLLQQPSKQATLPIGKQKKKSFFLSKSTKEPNQSYVQYHEYMKKVEQIQKKQFRRSNEFEKQLQKLNISPQGKSSKNASFYTFNDKLNGIQLHYFINAGEKKYYVFLLAKQQKNSVGLYKGRVKLLEQLYKRLLGTEVILVDQDEVWLQFA